MDLIAHCNRLRLRSTARLKVPAKTLPPTLVCFSTTRLFDLIELDVLVTELTSGRMLDIAKYYICQNFSVLALVSS